MAAQQDEQPTRPCRRLVIGVGLLAAVPIALYIAAGVSAVWGFTRSNGEIDVTNGCESTVYVEVAGKIGFDGFMLGPGDTITVERPHTDEINAWRDTAVDNPNIRRISIPGDAESISIVGEACPT